MLNPLEMAYVGDTVFDLYVRTQLIDDGGRIKELHRAAVAHVNACAQAKSLTKLLPLLSEEELSVMRRGRNAHPRHHAPKAASTEDYAGATGLEALIGYLYLVGDFDRLNTLFTYIWED